MKLYNDLDIRHVWLPYAVLIIFKIFFIDYCTVVSNKLKYHYNFFLLCLLTIDSNARWGTFSIIPYTLNYCQSCSYSSTKIILLNFRLQHHQIFTKTLTMLNKWSSPPTRRKFHFHPLVVLFSNDFFLVLLLKSLLLNLNKILYLDFTIT